MQVMLDPNSHMLTISGHKDAKEGESESRMSFTRSFSLPEVSLPYTQTNTQTHACRYTHMCTTTPACSNQVHSALNQA